MLHHSHNGNRNNPNAELVSQDCFELGLNQEPYYYSTVGVTATRDWDPTQSLPTFSFRYRMSVRPLGTLTDCFA